MYSLIFLYAFLTKSVQLTAAVVLFIFSVYTVANSTFFNTTFLDKELSDIYTKGQFIHYIYLGSIVYLQLKLSFEYVLTTTCFKSNA